MVAAVAVLVALLIGGLTQVSRQSQGYDASSNRTLAAQGRVVAEQSNATADSVTALMNVLQTQSRIGLQIALDSIVQQSSGESSRATAAADAAPASVSTDFAAVFAERAQSMSELRAAIDGFLGMQPQPVAGTPTAVATTTGSAILLSATQATNRIAAAGAKLAQSDALYGSVRRTLAADAGNGRLPKSVWVSEPQQWAIGTVASEIDLMATSPTLAATHDLVLRTVRVTPPALPTPQGVPANVSVITPTTQISVNAVMANDGTVDEPHASVRFAMSNLATGSTSMQAETVVLSSGASAALPTATFRVKPGNTYVLAVSVDLPAGQTQTAGTAIEQDLQVAPGT